MARTGLVKAIPGFGAVAARSRRIADFVGLKYSAQPRRVPSDDFCRPETARVVFFSQRWLANDIR
jgi:hypothetical protein